MFSKFLNGYTCCVAVFFCYIPFFPALKHQSYLKNQPATQLSLRQILQNPQDRYRILEYTHFPLWILKDFSWFAALHFEEYAQIFQYTSLIFAFPTISISIYLIFKGESRFKVMENVLLGSWLLANTLWMVSELFHSAISIVSIISFTIGVLVVPVYLRTLYKSFTPPKL